MIVAHSDVSLKGDFLGLGYALYRSTPSKGKVFLEASHRIFNVNELPHEYDSCRGEYRAVISAVRAAMEYSEDYIMVQCDCEPVVRWINEHERVADDGYFRHALFSFLGRYDNWSVSWTPRENNTIADMQARCGVMIMEEVAESHEELGVEV